MSPLNYVLVFASLLTQMALINLFASEQVVYKKVGEIDLTLDIEKPADWKATDKRPAIVFYFGGGWVSGTPTQFQKQSEYLATRGMVGIRVKYRTIPKGDKLPLLCCADAKSAMRYVRSHAAELGIDPTCRAEDVAVEDYVRIANYLS